MVVPVPDKIGINIDGIRLFKPSPIQRTIIVVFSKALAQWNDNVTSSRGVYVAPDDVVVDHEGFFTIEDNTTA